MNHSKGFTLIEIIIVIGIMVALSSIIVATANTSMKKARDAKRILEITQIRKALDLYFYEFGAFPESDKQGWAAWDTPGDGDFLKPLADNGIMPNISDPRTNDDRGNYAYYRYEQGAEGCDPAKGAFYVLGIRDLETSSGRSSNSPGWRCAGRDWHCGFEWVSGKFESDI